MATLVYARCAPRDATLLFYGNSTATKEATFQSSKSRGDADIVTYRDRDLAVTALRCLHTFYCLDHHTFATAVYLLDQFLSRLKVKKKHLSCAAAACYLVACKLHEDMDVPKTSHLSVLYGKEWSTADLCRMEAIILQKLQWQIHPTSYIECITVIMECLERHVVDSHILWEAIVHKAEICMEFTQCASFRDATLAISCTEICLKQEKHAKKELSMIVANLQFVCDIPDSELFECKNAIKCCLDKYYTRNKISFQGTKRLNFYKKSLSIKKRLVYYGETDLPTIPEDAQEVFVMSDELSGDKEILN